MKYLTRGKGYTLLLAAGEATLSLDAATVRMKLLGADRTVEEGSSACRTTVGTLAPIRGSDTTR